MSSTPEDYDDSPSLDQWPAMQGNIAAMMDPVTASLNNSGVPPLQIPAHWDAPIVGLQIEKLLSLFTYTGIT
jgi:hypothetical protein